VGQGHRDAGNGGPGPVSDSSLQSSGGTRLGEHGTAEHREGKREARESQRREPKPSLSSPW
jgi:hypothetical protein